MQSADLQMYTDLISPHGHGDCVFECIIISRQVEIIHIERRLYVNYIEKVARDQTSRYRHAQRAAPLNVTCVGCLTVFERRSIVQVQNANC